MSRQIENPNFPDNLLFTKLRNWCLSEGGFKVVGHSRIQTSHVGPVKYITKDFMDNPEVLSISVAADSKSPAFNIEVKYMCDGRPLNNPVVCVTQEGKVIRVHGDFVRIRQWVSENL